MAETKAEAYVAFDFFVEDYGVKYDRAVKCLIKDRGRCQRLLDILVLSLGCKRFETAVGLAG